MTRYLADVLPGSKAKQAYTLKTVWAYVHHYSKRCSLRDLCAYLNSTMYFNPKVDVNNPDMGAVVSLANLHYLLDDRQWRHGCEGTGLKKMLYDPLPTIEQGEK